MSGSIKAFAVRAMLKRATPSEASVIEPVALACGFLWRCRSGLCGHLEDDGNAFCSKCHLSRN